MTNGTRKNSGTVLIVDDTKVNLIIAKRMLKEEGYETMTAQNGQEAVDIIKTGLYQFCLILMDHTMPIMNGSDATKEIKQIDPSLPIVGLTTELNPTILENFVKSGLCGVYSKPVSRDGIKNITRKHSK